MLIEVSHVLAEDVPECRSPDHTDLAVGRRDPQHHVEVAANQHSRRVSGKLCSHNRDFIKQRIESVVIRAICAISGEKKVLVKMVSFAL